MSRVRPFDLPVLETITPDTAIVADNGELVGRTTPTNLADFAAPVASQEEAELGLDNSKRMTPLRTKQAIDATLSNGAVGAGAISNDPAEQEGISRKIGAVRRYSTIDDLRAAPKPAATAVAFVEGYYQSDDGGGGNFYWDAASDDTVDGGMVFDTTSGGVGRWRRNIAPYAASWVSVRWFGAKGDGIADDTAAIQAACNYAANLRWIVRLPAGRYRTTSEIRAYNVNATLGSTACAIQGDGPFTSRIVPDHDGIAIWIISSYLDNGGFSVEWPATARADIPGSRIGVEIGHPNHQVSQCRIHDIIVMYAFQSFRQRDWTSAGTGLGSTYVIDYERLISFRAADWGFYIRSAVGASTTNRFSTCWANCSDMDGNHGGMGFWVSGVNDVVTINCAVDKCKDRAFRFGDGTTNAHGNLSGYQVTMIGTALESCSATTHGLPLIQIDGPIAASIIGVKEVDTTVNIPSDGIAYTVFSNKACTVNVEGYARANKPENQISGTLYKAGLNSADTRMNFDRSIAFNEVYDNGWFSQFSWGGIRYSSAGNAPTQGTNQQGEYVRNMKAAIGQPKGWYCTASGSPGTWVSEGDL